MNSALAVVPAGKNLLVPQYLREDGWKSVGISVSYAS